MAEDPTPAPGLMGALAPIALRRPVHITASAAEDGRLHLVIQPVRLNGETEAEIARGFAVTGTPEELDDELPTLLASRWVPAHASLQKVIDQVAAAAERARDGTLRKAAKGGRAPAAGPAEDDRQTLLLTTPEPGAGAGAATGNAGITDASGAGAPADGPQGPDAAAPGTGSGGPVDAPPAAAPRETSRTRGRAARAPAASVPPLQLVPPTPAADSVSALFD